MNLNNLRYIFQNLAELYGYNKPLTIDNFNNYLWMADHELEKQVYGKLNSEEGYETKKQISDALLPFKATTNIVLVTGVGNLPSDYFHVDNVYAATNVPAEVVTNKEFIDRIDNAITAPDTSNPICTLYSTTISVNPTSFTPVTFRYFKKSINATKPELVLKTENGVEVYDSANSEALLWGTEFYIDIIRIMLGFLAIAVSNQNILSYVEQKQIAEHP